MDGNKKPAKQSAEEKAETDSMARKQAEGTISI